MQTAAPAAQFTFERVVRDCPYNANLLANKGPTRDLIYDYRVLREGEHVATFSRNVRGSGWELYDRIGRPIHSPDRSVYSPKHLGQKCRSKDEWPTLLEECAVNIPTAQQCAAWQASERRRKQREKQAAADQARKACIERAGPELFEALKKVRELNHGAPVDPASTSSNASGLSAAIRLAHETLTRIEEKAAAAAARAAKQYVEENGGEA